MQELRAKVAELREKQVTQVIAGGANGSIIVLEFDHRYLLTVYSAWRLEQSRKALTGWNESAAPQAGPIPLEMRLLQADRVKAVHLSDLYDLKVTFESRKVLNVFCDLTPRAEPAEYDQNWVLCDQDEDRCFAVTKEFAVVTSRYR